ncbi:ORF6N domain-containing protein [Xenorhabdus bovienii]|uniref:ORF6N domain-containing protein n=1 Tax=Xenorhabdus bovienii TaxID=40576 RepID=UPI0023B26193|nr:ORF6N domain-containing protein [Xenorhabdus bovienii]MDE9539809.1 ORF6N domain-containing protein [Xenorhabdus bovienii]
MLSIPLNQVTKNVNSVQSMTAIMHNSIPVITTELLAGVYETDVNNIQQNFKRNKDRFVEGKHFFKLTGSILKNFKNRLTNCQSVGKNARSLTLWTERGAARHAKMLDTDQAWNVFEKLEDFYFNQKEAVEVKPKTRRSTASQLTPLRQTAERLITTGLGRIYPDIWKLVHEHFEIKHITQLEPTQIAEAIEFLNVLEGEYLGKEDLPSPQSTKMDLSLELNNIGVIYAQLKKMTDIWKESIYPALELVNSPIASKFHTYLWDVSGAAYSTKCAIERKAKKLLN